jgi:tRNA-specific 2-thiouridylase
MLGLMEQKTMPAERKRVVIAMSGGVDSSLAAALLLEQGFDVIGLTLSLFELPPEYCRSEDIQSCCGKKAAEDANRVAHSLGIMHYVVDMKELFAKAVIDNFCEEYIRGRTPNPCIRCNRLVKFGALLPRLETLEADFLATGHYARITVDRGSGAYRLKKGRDDRKDQSYFLYDLTQEQMARVLFPLGELTKKEVREKAQDIDLPVARRPESQEICFIPNNDYVPFLRNHVPGAFRPGLIRDLEGRIVGRHDGLPQYTIGQRRGMGISASHPLYIVDIRPETNEIIVGKDEDLYTRSLRAGAVNWISGSPPSEPVCVHARIRSRHEEAKALLRSAGDEVTVEFDEPQRAVTPGQSVVFYDGDTVLGGAVIQ